jgi:hypothetical protein
MPYPVKEVGNFANLRPNQPKFTKNGKIALPFFPAFDQDTVVICPHQGSRGF